MKLTAGIQLLKELEDELIVEVNDNPEGLLDDEALNAYSRGVKRALFLVQARIKGLEKELAVERQRAISDFF